MLTYIQDITAAETQRKHQTPESPDGYFPDRCLKNTFCFFFYVVGILQLQPSSEGRKKLAMKDEKAPRLWASNHSF